jgi:hypothetical protein
MTKLPEPVHMGCDVGFDVFAYTEAQMLQFRRDALEEAAKLCEETKQEIAGKTKIEWTVSKYPTNNRCARAIRKLKDET